MYVSRRKLLPALGAGVATTLFAALTTALITLARWDL